MSKRTRSTTVANVVAEPSYADLDDWTKAERKRQHRLWTQELNLQPYDKLVHTIGSRQEAGPFYLFSPRMAGHVIERFVKFNRVTDEEFVHILTKCNLDPAEVRRDNGVFNVLSLQDADVERLYNSAPDLLIAHRKSTAVVEPPPPMALPMDESEDKNRCSDCGGTGHKWLTWCDDVADCDCCGGDGAQ